MNTTNEDHELLKKLKSVLIEAQQEKRRASLRVQRLEQQVSELTASLSARLSASNNNNNNNNNYNYNHTNNTNRRQPSTPTDNQFYLAQPSTEAQTHFLDTSSSYMPSGWSTAVDAQTQKTYYYHASTNVVQWHAPGTHTLQQSLNTTATAITSTSKREVVRRGSVYDKLTDHKLYTGVHKNRFDTNGNGVPDTANNNKANTKAGSSHQNRRNSKYTGSTNAKSDELFHDSSEFLCRNNFQEDGKSFARMKF